MQNVFLFDHQQTILQESDSLGQLSAYLELTMERFILKK